MRLNWLNEKPKDPEPEAGGGGQGTLPLDGVTGDPPGTPKTPDPEVAALKQTVAQTQQSLADLQTLLRSRPAPPEHRAPQPSQEEITAEFFKNPVPIVAAIAQNAATQAQNAIQAQQYEPNLKAAREAARQADPEIFDKFLPQIKAHVEQFHPQARTDPRIWENAYKSVVGENLDEVYKMRQTRKASTGGPALPSGRGAPAGAKPQGLSDEEKRVAEDIFHMTPEEYQKGKDIFEKQSTHLENKALDALRSPWAQVITFDSTKPRQPRKKAGAAA